MWTLVLHKKEGNTYIENNVFGKRLQKLIEECDLKATNVVQLSKKYDETGKDLSKIFSVNSNYLMVNTNDPYYNYETLT